MPAEPRENALMAAYAAGDVRALDALFNALAPRLLAFFQRCDADPSLAEELLQATFLQLHQERRAYHPGTSLRLWLFSIAAHVRREQLRRRGGATPDTWRAAPLLSERGRAAVSGAHSDGRDRAVREALDALQGSERAILHLHRYESMTFAEIAQVLGAREDAVRAQALRTYRSLLERLQPLVGEGTPS
jgi:RNA polymerase sigma factor (sigma-70 family)